jgi:hypothetical protein
MMSRSLTASRYGKQYTCNRERIKSRISMIRGMMNSGNSNRDNMRDVTDYRISVRYTSQLAHADVKIRKEVFGKTSSTILSNSQLGMRNRSGTETHDK